MTVDECGVSCANEFIIVRLNIRSLPGNFAQLENLVRDLQEKGRTVAAVLLCETWLSDLNSSCYIIRGFKLYELHRKNSKGGGVGMAGS